MATRVLICAYGFHPDVGGTETAAMTLATGLTERGYDISVVTMTPAASRHDDERLPFATVRKPGGLRLLRLFQRSDVVWHNHVSLRLLWPVMFVHRPLVFVHHCPIATDTGPADTQTGGSSFEWLKRAACKLGQNAYVSRAYRDAAALPGPVIYNTYDEATFHPWPDVRADRDVVFLGRLVRQKGADLLIDALHLLARKGLRLRTTIIGSGPREEELKAQVAARGLDALVAFTGALRGHALSRTLARHRIMAMPSRGFEGLGISAIEALACGCVVVASDSGGLPEAVGPAGLTVQSEGTAQLAAALERLITDASLYESCRTRIPQHLRLFSKDAVTDKCEELIRNALGQDRFAGHGA